MKPNICSAISFHTWRHMQCLTSVLCGSQVSITAALSLVQWFHDISNDNFKVTFKVSSHKLGQLKDFLGIYYTFEREIDFSAPFQVNKEFFRCIQFECNYVNCEEPFGTLVCNKMYCWINIRHTLIVRAKVVSMTEYAVYTTWTIQWVFPFFFYFAPN